MLSCIIGEGRPLGFSSLVGRSQRLERDENRSDGYEVIYYMSAHSYFSHISIVSVILYMENWRCWSEGGNRGPRLTVGGSTEEGKGMSAH